MAKHLFSNVARTALLSDLASTDTQIIVADKQNFPAIGANERLRLTVIGACSDNVEIIDVNADCGANCWSIIERGLEGTTPADFDEGDPVVLQLTAEIVSDMYTGNRWYLGPFATAPTADQNGDPLIAGMLYYNTTTSVLQIWDGTAWRPFSILGSASIIAEYTWVFPAGHTAGIALPATDVYGTPMVDLDVNNHSLVVFLNGSKIIDELDDAIISGDYVVDYDADEIIPIQNLPNDAVIQALVLIKDNIDISHGSLADRPASGNIGQQYYVVESDTFYVYNGSVWTAQNVPAYLDDEAARAVYVNATTLQVTAGKLLATSGNVIKLLAPITKTNATPWTAGSGLPGATTLFTERLLGVFLIQDPINGLIDVCFSNQWDASDRPAAYTDCALVAIVPYNGSNNFRPFQHVGNVIHLHSNIVVATHSILADDTAEAMTVSATLNAPNNAIFNLYFHAQLNSATAAALGEELKLLLWSDLALVTDASSVIATYYTQNTSALAHPFGGMANVVRLNGGFPYIQIQAGTNLSGQQFDITATLQTIFMSPDVA